MFFELIGMACLHGYKVQSSVNASVRKFAFELIPPDLSFRYFYFYTDTEMDKRRYSQKLRRDKWITIWNALGTNNDHKFNWFILDG